MNIWRVPIDEETGEVLGEAVPVTSGTSSPGGLSVARDGSRLAYSARKLTLQIESVGFDPVKERIVGEPGIVTPAGLDSIYPTVAPDGEWIAFAGRFAGPRSWAIGAIRTDGTGLRQLTDSGTVETYPVWSPDGERIAFWSRRSGSREVWVVRRDGSGRRQLTDSPDKTVQPPVWSPDGKRLATAINYGSTYVFDGDKPWVDHEPDELSLAHGFPSRLGQVSDRAPSEAPGQGASRRAVSRKGGPEGSVSRAGCPVPHDRRIAILGG